MRKLYQFLGSVPELFIMDAIANIRPFYQPQVHSGRYKKITYIANLFSLLFLLLIYACSGVSSKNTDNGTQRNVLLLHLLLQEPEKEINVNGLTRKYLDFVPTTLPDDPSVLLVFHGSGGSATKFRNTMGATLERMAIRENYIIIYLTGFEGHFNDCRKMGPYSAKKLNIDDRSFAKAVVEKLRNDTGKKLSNVYALGYSNGAQMAYRLAMEENFLKGIIAVSANVPAPENMDCTPVMAKPHPRVAIIQGSRDPINPTEGGDVGGSGTASRGKVLSTKRSAEWFVEQYGIETPPHERQIPTKKSLLSGILVWEKEGEGVMMILLDGYGHTVPQEFSPFPLALGATYQDNSILENAWKFISQK